MPTKPRAQSLPSDSAIVAKAALRAADRLDVTNKLLAKIIGVSEATISRMRRGEYPLENKPFDRWRTSRSSSPSCSFVFIDRSMR